MKELSIALKRNHLTVKTAAAEPLRVPLDGSHDAESTYRCRTLVAKQEDECGGAIDVPREESVNFLAFGPFFFKESKKEIFPFYFFNSVNPL